MLSSSLCANLWSISHIPTWWHHLHAHTTYIVNLQAPLQVLGSFTNQCLEDEMAHNYGHDISHPCHCNPLESRFLRIRLFNSHNDTWIIVTSTIVSVTFVVQGLHNLLTYISITMVGNLFQI